MLEGVNLTNEPNDQFISRERNSAVVYTVTGREYLAGVRVQVLSQGPPGGMPRSARRFFSWRRAIAALGLPARAADPEAVRVILVGDSTMAPRTGYGDALCGLFKLAGRPA